MVVNLPTLSIIAREFIFKEFALTLPVLSLVAKEFMLRELADTEGAAIAPVDDIACVGDAVLPTFRLLLIYTKGVTTWEQNKPPVEDNADVKLLPSEV